jgi:hypothetical protein
MRMTPMTVAHDEAAAYNLGDGRRPDLCLHIQTMSAATADLREHFGLDGDCRAPRRNPVLPVVRCQCFEPAHLKWRR